MDKPDIVISLAHLTGLRPESRYKGHIVEVHSPTSPESACTTRRVRLSTFPRTDTGIGTILATTHHGHA